MEYIFILLALGCILLVFNAILVKYTSRKLKSEVKVYTYNECLQFAKELALLIQCKTVSNASNIEVEEFKKFREKLKELFPNVYKKAELKIFGDGCLVYKIKGVDETRNIMLMSHHDVVSANETWEQEPFGGEIINGKLWGRGTVDTKTSFYAELKAMDELLKKGVVPEVNVYIASSNNEEVAGKGIPLAVAHFKENKIKFELTVDEGGAVINAPVPGMKAKAAMIAVHEKGRKDVKCVAKCKFGHASFTAKSDSPVVRMAKFIEEIERRKPFIRKIHPETSGMFKALVPYMSFPYRLIFANLWLFSPLLKVLLPKLNPQGAALLGTTNTFRHIHGEKNKDVETLLFLQCVNDEDLRGDMKAIRKVAGKYDIDIEEISEEYHQPTDLEERNLLYVKEIINKVFPNVVPAPYILPAGSDARHMTDICRCTLRFAPIDISPEQFASVHNKNENIDVEAIGKAVAFYKEIISNYK